MEGNLGQGKEKGSWIKQLLRCEWKIMGMWNGRQSDQQDALMAGENDHPPTPELKKKHGGE